MTTNRHPFAMLDFPFNAHQVAVDEKEIIEFSKPKPNEDEEQKIAINDTTCASSTVTSTKKGVSFSEKLIQLYLGMKSVLNNPLEAIEHLTIAEKTLREHEYESAATFNYLALAHQRCASYYASQSNEARAAFHKARAFLYCEKASSIEKSQATTLSKLSSACACYVRAQLSLSDINNDSTKELSKTDKEANTLKLDEATKNYRDLLKNIESAQATDYKYHYIKNKLQYIRLLIQQEKPLERIDDIFRDVEKKYYPAITTIRSFQITEYLWNNFVEKTNAKYTGMIAIDFYELYGDYLDANKIPHIACSRYQKAYDIALDILGEHHERTNSLKKKLSSSMTAELVITKTVIEKPASSAIHSANESKFEDNSGDKKSTLTKFWGKTQQKKEGKQALLSDKSNKPSYGMN